MKILDVSWCCDYGFVTIDNGCEIKTYIGKVGLAPEQQNVDNIVRFGRRVFPEQLERILSFHKERKCTK